MTTRRGLAPLHLIALFVLALVFVPDGRAADMAGQVQAVVGSARLYDAAGKERDIQKRAEIRPGDRIVTGDQSLVQIKLTDGSYLSVRMNTDVAIEQYRHDEQAPKESGILLKLARGALRSITGLIGSANPDGYRIATPTATIGIRGTDHEPVFIPEPGPGETPIGTPGTYDKVNSGATIIRAATGAIDIRPGQVGFVPAVVRVPPTILPKLPDFFKNLDPSKEKAAARGQGRESAPEKTGGRPTGRAEAAGDGDKSARSGTTGDRDNKPARSGETNRIAPLFVPIAIDRNIGDSAAPAEGAGDAPAGGHGNVSRAGGDGDKSARSGETSRVAPMLAPVGIDRGGDFGPKANFAGEGAIAPRMHTPITTDRLSAPTRTTISPQPTTTITNTIIKR